MKLINGQVLIVGSQADTFCTILLLSFLFLFKKKVQNVAHCDSSMKGVCLMLSYHLYISLNSHVSLLLPIYIVITFLTPAATIYIYRWKIEYYSKESNKEKKQRTKTPKNYK